MRDRLAVRVDRAYLRADACVRARSSLVAATPERKAPLHAVSAPVRDSRGQGRVLLHPQERQRPAAEPRLWQIDRVRGRSSREEAAEPLLPGTVGALVRHGRMQPRMQVLPELGHQQGAHRRETQRRRITRADRRARAAQRVQRHRLHLQRSGDLGGVRDRHRRGRARGGIEERVRLRRLRDRRSEARDLPLHGRDQHRSQGVHRRLLSPRHVVASRAGARNARVVAAREQRLAGDHHAADPRTQRLRPGDRRGVRVDRRSARAGRPAALHRVPPGLQDDGPSAHSGFDVAARTRDRAAVRRSILLRRATCTTRRARRRSVRAVGAR